MAHYAFLDDQNIVTEVIVGKDEGEDGIDWEIRYSEIRGQICKRTSYNTQAGQHINGGIPFRKNYAGIGFVFDEQRDAFIPPKPYNSWVLDEETCLWNSPIPKPADGLSYIWDEENITWKVYDEV